MTFVMADRLLIHGDVAALTQRTRYKVSFL